MEEELRTIFTAEPGERIVSAISYRGRALIATEHRLLEWSQEKDTIEVLDVVTIHSDPARVVAKLIKSRY